jgi:hypothetical protein
MYNAAQSALIFRRHFVGCEIWIGLSGGREGDSGMEDLIVWVCLKLGSSRCYVLSSGEKAMYLAGMITVLMAVVLLFYGTLIRLFTR